jgi:hypothetical protein
MAAPAPHVRPGASAGQPAAAHAFAGSPILYLTELDAIYAAYGGVPITKTWQLIVVGEYIPYMGAMADRSDPLPVAAATVQAGVLPVLQNPGLGVPSKL